MIVIRGGLVGIGGASYNGGEPALMSTCRFGESFSNSGTAVKGPRQAVSWSCNSPIELLGRAIPYSKLLTL